MLLLSLLLSYVSLVQLLTRHSEIHLGHIGISNGMCRIIMSDSPLIH